MLNPLRFPHIVSIGLIVSVLILSACDGNNTRSETTSETDTSNKVLNIYNWSDYVDDSTIKDFEKQTGIKVNYSVYDSNETLQAKVLVGNSGYDLVGPGNVFLPRQIIAGAYQKLDKSKIPNYHNIDPELLKLLDSVDPGNQYVVPYFWGINTIGINRTKVEKALNGALPENEWDLIFKPEYAEKLQSCGISILDSPSEVYPLVLHYLGKEAQGKSAEDLEAAAAILQGVRPFIKRFTSSGYIDDLARGDLCLVLGYGGDLNIARNRAKEAHNGIEIDVLVPKGGVAIWIDSLAIPADASNVANALAYINYTLDPQVAAKNGNFVTYAPSSKPARALMAPQYVNDPSIFLPEEAIKASFLNVPLDLKSNRIATKLWNKMKKSD